MITLLILTMLTSILNMFLSTQIMLESIQAPIATNAATADKAQLTDDKASYTVLYFLMFNINIFIKSEFEHVCSVSGDNVCSQAMMT